MDCVFATRNNGKLRELDRLVQGIPFRFRPVSDFPGAPDVVEDGDTFAHNSALKALSAFEHTGLPALADDSGICVEALGGAPGVLSARYGGVDGDNARNNARILHEMAANDSDEQRRCWFQATLVFVGPAELVGEGIDDSLPRGLIPEGVGARVFVGKTHGVLLKELRGDGGFGYDPLFLSIETAGVHAGMTFAELPMDVKNAISHRGRAFAELLDYLKTLG